MRTPWADIHDDTEDSLPNKIQDALTNGGLTIIATKELNETISDLQSWINWWHSQNPHNLGNSAHAPFLPSPPLAPRRSTVTKNRN